MVGIYAVLDGGCERVGSQTVLGMVAVAHWTEAPAGSGVAESRPTGDREGGAVEHVNAAVWCREHHLYPNEQVDLAGVLYRGTEDLVGWECQVVLPRQSLALEDRLRVHVDDQASCRHVARVLARNGHGGGEVDGR